MFVLVTQGDGSARRVSWLTYAIVAGLAAFYMQQQPQQQAGFDAVDRSRQEALSFLNENAYVIVEDRFSGVIPLELAEVSREAFFKERREQGFALLPERLMVRGQAEFDELLEVALVEIEKLPAWKLGIRSKDAPRESWIAHIAVHENQAGLVFAVVLLLCLGIALEDAWGSIAFGSLAASGVAATAYASVSVDYVATTGTPWIGAGGLIATLMGAYFFRYPPWVGSPRAFGMLPMPAWLMLPIWLGVEYVGFRGVSFSNEIAVAPVIVHGVGLGLGAFVSTAMFLLRVERRSLDRDQAGKVLVNNRVLERAMLAKDAGKIEQAFELLRMEYRLSPDDRDVALALWDLSTQLGKAPDAADAMMSVIERDLQSKNAKQAVSNWFALIDEVTSLPANSKLFVRIGEVLLDAGHEGAAVAAVTRSFEATKPLTSALAQRIIRITRDLDPDVTRRAAEIALQDGQLSAANREEFERLRDREMPTAIEDQHDTPALPVSSASEETSVDASNTMTVTAVAETERGQTPDTPVSDIALDDSAARQSMAGDYGDDISALDPQALSLEALEEELEQGSGEVVSQENWNTPGLIDDLSDELAGDFDELDDADLIEAAMEAGILDDTVTRVNLSNASSADAEPERTVTEVRPPPESDDETTTVVNIGSMRRKLKIRNAVPIALEKEAILIEVDGGNKARLPYSRIDALAAAAIQGLAEKPVVLVDLIVNWPAASEPIKVVRLRSDRFDPVRLTSGAANPLEAFRTLVTNLVRDCNAVPLPNFNAATGAPFQVFAGLAQYDLEVLGGVEDLEGHELP